MIKWGLSQNRKLSVCMWKECILYYYWVGVLCKWQVKLVGKKKGMLKSSAIIVGLFLILSHLSVFSKYYYVHTLKIIMSSWWISFVNTMKWPSVFLIILALKYTMSVFKKCYSYLLVGINVFFILFLLIYVFKLDFF